MICFLEGTVAQKQPTRLVMDVGGVGYELLIPLSSYDRLPALGGRCRILTHDYVREDQHLLFGFMTEAERRAFTLLLSVTGVGPKVSLSVLSGMTVRDMIVAIVERDVKRLASIPGIGKKTAERLTVELRDKIGDAEALEAAAGAGVDGGADSRARDAVLALIALGYKRDAACRMIETAARRCDDEKATVEDLIKAALGSAAGSGNG